MKSQSHRPTVRPSVFLGGDAGGSHSAVAIGREDGTVLGRAEGPGAAMRPGGAAASAVVLADIARRAAIQAATSLPVDRAVVGAAGAGRAQEQQELAAALVAAGIARAARVLAMTPVVLGTVIPSFPIRWLSGLAWPWYVPLGTAVTVAVGVATSFVGRSDPKGLPGGRGRTVGQEGGAG